MCVRGPVRSRNDTITKKVRLCHLHRRTFALSDICIVGHLGESKCSLGIVLRETRTCVFDHGQSIPKGSGGHSDEMGPVKMVGTSKATWDGNCVSPQSITVCTRLKPLLVPSATTSMVLRNPKTSLCQVSSRTTPSFPHGWLRSSQRSSMVYSNRSFS